MSLMHCTALQDIAVMHDDNFFLMDTQGIGRESMKHFMQSEFRMEVVLQWVQHLVCEGQKNGILWIAPPILSRVFQELSNGVVIVNDAMKITEYPFPYPYAQMLTILLLAF